MVPITVLIIDDETALRRMIRIALEAQGYSVLEAADGTNGVVTVATERPDAVLLDLTLPDADGLEILQRIREFSNTPVLVVSARGDDSAKIHLLDAGADDYITKPFHTGELLARLRVALRHSPSTPEAHTYTIGNIFIDATARKVMVDNSEVNLTVTEYQLLLQLARNLNKTVSHVHLLREVWGKGAATDVQYLRVYINQLRKKLEPDPSKPVHIITIPGVGYRLE